MRVELARQGRTPDARLICFIAAPEEEFERLPPLSSSLVVVSVDSWENDLTPWPAPGAYTKQPAYGGNAQKTLDELLGSTLPQVELDLGLHPSSYAVAGYSLAGLFSLWAFCSTKSFDAVASGSGSLWYPDWVEWLRAKRFDGQGKRAYLSLGTKESRVRHPLVAKVADRTQQTAELLESMGVDCRFESNPGGHFTNISERISKALAFIDA